MFENRLSPPGAEGYQAPTFGSQGVYKNNYAELSSSQIDEDMAIVFFSDRTELWYLRWLKPGFRHCFICVRLLDFWVIVDPMSDLIQIGVIEGYGPKELRRFYEENGYTSCVTRIRRPVVRKSSWRLLTCVEVVKGILGLRDQTIVTPHNLYKYLKKEKLLDKTLMLC